MKNENIMSSRQNLKEMLEISCRREFDQLIKLKIIDFERKTEGIYCSYRLRKNEKF